MSHVRKSAVAGRPVKYSEATVKLSFRTTCIAAASVAIVGLMAASAPTALAQAPAAAAALPSPADFTRAASIGSVAISRDGKHLVALTSPDGETVNISVWRTDAPSQPPTVIGSSRMRFLGVEFLKNDRLIVAAIQPFTSGSTRRHLTKQYITDLEGREWKSLLPETHARSEIVAYYNAINDADILDSLPLDPKHVLVIDNRVETFGDVYKVDVYTGSASRVERASEKVVGKQTDLKGEVRARQTIDYEKGNVYFAQWIKHPDTGAWEEHFRWYAKDREPVGIAGFTQDPNIVYIATSKGTDKTTIYEYDIRSRKILEPLFQHKLFEASYVIQSSSPADYGRPLGFIYQAETNRIYWTDEKLAGVDKGLRKALDITTTPMQWIDPGTGEAAKISVTDGVDARISDWSEDRRLVIVEKSGPRQPPEYYLLNEAGQLTLLGRERPSMNTAALGDVRLVQYAARDGLMIPGFLTTPPKHIYGPGPYPTLILPHGGPWSRDNYEWDISGWTQYFATRGYAVLQPQFRGSEGWGQKLWRAGDAEWGQKMQDDKDDGVKWLIAQKIAAPDRVAMFGYSYGGYAALAAAIRPNGLYQCAISGAGAGDLAALGKATFENRFQREFQHPTIKGLDALARAREASIPVFLYHGDRDTIVEVEQSRKFAAQLKAAGLPHKYTEIKEMGHGYVTMLPAMMEQQLVEIEAYLKTDCGPGGL